jgi:hypothetical protein
VNHPTTDPNHTRLLAGAKLAGTVEAILEGHRDQLIPDAQLWDHLQTAHRDYRHTIDPLDSEVTHPGYPEPNTSAPPRKTTCPAAGGDQR